MAATASISFNSYSNAVVSISGLQYTGGYYSDYIFKLWKWNGSAWNVSASYTDYGYDFVGLSTESHTFTGIEPSGYYFPEIFIKYSGTWYPCDPSVDTSTDAYGYTAGYQQAPAIPQASISNISQQKTTITFDYTNSAGNMSLFVWNGSSYVGIASSGLPNTITSISGGYHIVLTNLIPNAEYDFHVKTYVGSYYSISVQDPARITTSAWPTVSTAPYIYSRTDGGYYLSWGDNSCEGSGFNYAVTIDGVGYYAYTGHTNQWGNNTDWSTYHSYNVTVGVYGYAQTGVYGWFVDASGKTSTSGFYSSPHSPTYVAVNSTTISSISLTASGMTGGYSAVEWRWRLYGSSDSFSSGIDYGGGMSRTISGLSRNTIYEVRCYGYYGTTGLYSESYYLKNPSTADYPPLDTPTISSNTYTTNTYTYTENSVANATSYVVTLWKAGSLQGTNTSASATTGSFTGLLPNTAYIINLTVSASGYKDATNAYSFTTNALATPNLPSNISFSQNGYTASVDISFTKGTNQTHTDIDMSSDGVNWGSIDWVHQALSSYTLATGYYGIHYFRLRSENSDGTNSVYSAWSSTYSSIFTDRPNNWAWTTSIVSGGNIYSTNLSTKTLYPFTATEWNNFTAKINAFRVYKSLSNYTFTTVSTGTVFTRAIFNEALIALREMSAYFTGGNNVPANRVTGDFILVASYFISMKDALNSIT